MAEYIIDLYRINVEQNRFDKVDEIITFENLSFLERLNGIGNCSFDLNIHDPKGKIENLRRYVTQVAVRRNESIVWLGGINKNRFEWDGVSGKTTVNAQSYLAHLSRRYSPAFYSRKDTEASTIAWDLINLVQSRTNGELMIRQGTLETIGNIEETLSYTSIAKAIMDQSDNLNGYDFNFTPTYNSYNELSTVLFNVYKGIGIIRNDLPPLEIGTTLESVASVTNDDILNEVTAEGAGTNNGVLTVTGIESTGSQTAYTRREAVLPLKNLQTTTELEKKADAYLNNYQVERYSTNLRLMPNTSLRYGAFSIGDVLKTYIEYPNGLTIDGYARVVDLTVQVTKEGVEELTPKLDIIL